MEDNVVTGNDSVDYDIGASASASVMAEDDELSFFVCQQCRYPIVNDSEIFYDRTEIYTDQVYSYEMEVLVDKSAWCYSATNPGAHRFDVLRVKKPLNARVTFDGEPTLEHTWFPGHRYFIGARYHHLT